MSSSSLFDSLYSNYSSRYDSSKYSGDNYERKSSAYSSSPYSYSSTYSSTYSHRYPIVPVSNNTSSTSSYDKYYNYLDDLTSSRRRNSNTDLKYSSSSGLPSSYSATSLRSSSKYLGEESTTSGLSSGPKYDQFGKELSNYDRWRLRNNSDKTADPDTSSQSKYRSRIAATKEESPKNDISSTFSSSRYRSSSILPSSTTSNASSNSYRSSFGSLNTVRNFPSGVNDKLNGYDVLDVRGDGGCYYRCLSLYFSGSEDNYMKYRREVMAYIRENVDNYSSMIKSELGRSSSTSDYFSRKMRADRQDWAETTEIIATCCVYDINVHVLALVPGRRSTWEWLHFDPSIGTGKPSHATKDIYLYNQGSVHFMLCKPK